MKVAVYAKYMVAETFEIEVDSEDQIRDEAWMLLMISYLNTTLTMFTMLIGNYRKIK